MASADGLGRKLLVLDTSYSLETIRANGLEASVTCRDLGGYFERVWTVHPFATLVTSEAYTKRYGSPVATEIATRHVFIEGKVGRFDALARVAAANFLVSQSEMLAHLVRLVRDNRISAIRAGDHLLMGLYGCALARLCGIPLVVRVNANYGRIRELTGRPITPRFFRTSGVERAVERFVLERADLVAGATEDNRQYAISMGAAPERSTVFRYGNLLDPHHLVAPAARDSGEVDLAELPLSRRPFLLCVGRLESVKMPDHAVRVLAMLRAQGIGVALLMVGAGSMLATLQKLARDRGVAEDVVFAGNRDQAWLSRVVPRAAVVLSPLTGRALCEVAFAGAPTVAYDMDWHAELIRTGETGELVPARDVRGMADAAAKFLTNRPYARRMGDQLRTVALDMLAPDRLDAHERAQYDLLFERRSRLVDRNNRTTLR